MSREFDPKTQVTVTRVKKEGAYYTVEGVVRGGKSETVHIPAPTIESRSRQSAEALMRRSLYGSSTHPKEE